MERLLVYVSYGVNVAILAGWIWGFQSRLQKKRLVLRLVGGAPVPIYFPLRYSQRAHGEVATEDFQAALHCAELFRAHNVECRFEQILRDVSPNIKPNSVVFCGPKTSAAVGGYMKQDPFYRVEKGSTEAWVVRDLASSNQLLSPIDQSPSGAGDLAYIARLNDGAGGGFLLLCGIHAIGSLGAAYFVCSRRNLRMLLRESRGGFFSVVISTRFEPGSLRILSGEVLLAVRRHA